MKHETLAIRIDTASEVQGECRAVLARAMLSRSLHSDSQLLVCEYKGTTFADGVGGLWRARIEKS